MAAQRNIPSMSSWGGKRAGSGRKRKYGDEKVLSRTYAVPESVDAEIERRATKQGKNASEIVVDALRRAFRMKPKEESDKPTKPRPPRSPR